MDPEKQIKHPRKIWISHLKFKTISHANIYYNKSYTTEENILCNSPIKQEKKVILFSRVYFRSDTSKFHSSDRFSVKRDDNPYIEINLKCKRYRIFDRNLIKYKISEWHNKHDNGSLGMLLFIKSRHAIIHTT